ncbi:NfeD family protein [Pelotalea chapellei]|uniref:Nodulation protein NfeD n=1 Tax=Pelotalea chapellei TaxID=44671 RepID=A0ABS5U6Y8_9BACT|nr:nodulation protein NfeD [Pelotalea chapellei]MBT1071408.1 nodulation protein NfeD [Pelotalea chapellei]
MIRLLLVFCLLLLFDTVPVEGAPPPIGIVTIDGTINPITTEYMQRSLKKAAQLGEQAVVIEMDTPGGLDTAMRAIIKSMFASSVPVVVYVAPAGARAASAGAVIALAADVCAMAPGTNIGAAHPVSMGEKRDKVMAAKVLNDAAAYVEGIAIKRGRNQDLATQMVRESLSLSAEKGLEGGVVDLMAGSRTELLLKLDNRLIPRNGGAVVLRTAGAELIRHEMGSRDKILDAVSNPNIAYLLMMLGFVGLFFELSTPGVILPGVIGAISLILAFFALQSLPVNYAGVLLILLALILFIAEIKVVSYGMLTISGIVAMTLGSLFLFRSPVSELQLSWSVIFTTVVTIAAFFSWVVNRGIKAHRRKPVTGSEGLTGENGIADSDMVPEGTVLVHGERWNAWSGNGPIRRGDQVEVVEVDGLRLRVRKVTRNARFDVSQL